MSSSSLWRDIPTGSTVEFQALPYIRRFGCDTYPYTRKHWVDDRISTLRSLTLESILGENARICGGSPPKDLGGVSDLKNRNILLYFSVSPHPVFGYFNCITLDYFHRFYRQMKEEYPGSEIIFVPLDQKLSDSNEVASLPWPRLSLPPTPLVDPKLLKWFQDQVIAFGPDNQIKSVRHVSSLVRNESASFRANNPMDSSYEKEGSSGGAGNQLGFVSTLRTSLFDDTLWEDTSSYVCSEILGQ